MPYKKNSMYFFFPIALQPIPREVTITRHLPRIKILQQTKNFQLVPQEVQETRGYTGGVQHPVVWSNHGYHWGLPPP